MVVLLKLTRGIRWGKQREQYHRTSLCAVLAWWTKAAWDRTLVTESQAENFGLAIPVLFLSAAPIFILSVMYINNFLCWNSFAIGFVTLSYWVLTCVWFRAVTKSVRSPQRAKKIQCLPLVCHNPVEVETDECVPSWMRVCLWCTQWGCVPGPQKHSLTASQPPPWESCWESRWPWGLAELMQGVQGIGLGWICEINVFIGQKLCILAVMFLTQ